MFVVADAVQSGATVVVAIVGVLSTLAAGVFAHRRETETERTRWVRDRRADLYLAVTDAVHKGQIHAHDRHVLNVEIEALTEEQGEAASELEAFKSGVKASSQPADVDRSEAELNSLARKIEGFRERHDALESRLGEEDRRLAEHVEQLQDLFTPVQVIGSEQVKRLSSEIQGQLTALLAASVEPEGQDNLPLMARWAKLHAAMRADLGVTD